MTAIVLKPMTVEDQRIVNTLIEAHNTAMYALRSNQPREGATRAALLAVIKLLPIWHIIPATFQDGPDVVGKEKCYSGMLNAKLCFEDVANTAYWMSMLNQATSELWAATMAYADEAIQNANPEASADVVRAQNIEQHLHQLQSIYASI